ncbi:MAG: hypothetical protein ACRCXD_19380 [Luteolibacter sp.]
MRNRPPDPHPAVPEDSPDGVWEDPQEVRQGDPRNSVSLPARRTSAESRKGRADPEIGLRIESTLHRSDSFQRLEVTEHGGEVVRLDQAEKAPSKVERLYTFHEKPMVEPSGKTSVGEGREWGMVHRHPVRWILGMGGVVTVLIVAVFLLLPLINSPNAPTKDPNALMLTVEEEEKVEGMEAMDELLAQLPEAMQIFRAYAQASLVEDIVPLIKNGKSLVETLGRHWEPLRMPSSWAPDVDSAWSVQELSGQPYGVLAGELPDDRRFAAYFTRWDGRLVMDWKATVAFGTAPFTRLAEGNGDASEIRGEISTAEYYNAVWPEDQYRSFRLTSPDRETSIWCYARIGSAAEAALASLLNQGAILEEFPSSLKITLHLVRGAPQALPNQWLIEEVFQTDWATP